MGAGRQIGRKPGTHKISSQSLSLSCVFGTRRACSPEGHRGSWRRVLRTLVNKGPFGFGIAANLANPR
jgi:hypothetical protein